MLEALVNEKLVNAINADSGIIGECPHCGKPVRARCGELNDEHWSHIDSECPYITEKDTEWHTYWKYKFEKEGCIKEKKFDNFIADVYNPKTNTITEFQHSSITSQEIRNRCNYYKSTNRNIKWIFDYTKEYKRQHVKLTEKISDNDNKFYYNFNISYQKKSYIQGVSYRTFDESIKLSVPIYLNIIHNYDAKNYTQLRVTKDFDEYKADMYNNRYKNYLDNLNNSMHKYGDINSDLRKDEKIHAIFNDNKVLAEIKYDVSSDVLLEVKKIYEKGKYGWGYLVFI